MLDARLTPEEVKARLLSPRFRNRQFSGLLLDQSFLAGLGNYLRVEILWQVGLTGQHKAKDLNEAQLNALSRAVDIPRLSYTTAVRRMRTSIMAHCFALSFSTVTAKRVSGAAALLKRQHCPHARFTGARIARNSRNRHRRAAIA